MTPEAKRITIAKSSGWIKAIGHDLWCAPSPEGLSTRRTRDIPDYFSDLNAMHEVEKTLNRTQWQNYTEELLGIVYRTASEDVRDHQALTNATAAQRAEAFLRTLDKWID